MSYIQTGEIHEDRLVPDDKAVVVKADHSNVTYQWLNEDGTRNTEPWAVQTTTKDWFERAFQLTQGVLA